MLQAKGFGILTEIDVQATMKKKLNIDKRPYKILGACNPLYANKVLDADPDIGIFLPYNVLVYENEDETITISATNPNEVFSLINNPDVKNVANEVDKIFRSVLEEAKNNLVVK